MRKRKVWPVMAACLLAMVMTGCDEGKAGEQEHASVSGEGVMVEAPWEGEDVIEVEGEVMEITDTNR